MAPDLTANNVSSSSGGAFVAKVAMALATDAHEVSEATGGAFHFNQKTGENNAGRNDLLLGSITETGPGIPLPGDQATLPLNRDLLTSTLINLINTPIFQNSKGTLIGRGYGNAALNLGPVPGAVGGTMYFAIALNARRDFASNPVAVQIVSRAVTRGIWTAGVR